MKNILLIGAAVYVLSLVGKTQAAAKLRVSFAGAKWDGGKIRLRFNVTNISGYSLNIRALVGDVYVNGRNVATVQNTSGATIEGGAVSPLTLDASPSVGLVTFVYNVIRSGIKSATVAFRGNLSGEGFIIPVNQTTKFAV